MYLGSGKYTNNKAVYFIPGKGLATFSAVVYRENATTKLNNFIISNHVGDKQYIPMNLMHKVLRELKVIRLFYLESPEGLKDNFQVTTGTSSRYATLERFLREGRILKNAISLILSQRNCDIFLAIIEAPEDNSWNKLLIKLNDLIEWLSQCIRNDETKGAVKVYNVFDGPSALSGGHMEISSVTGRGSNLLVVSDSSEQVLTVTSTGSGQRILSMVVDNEVLTNIINALNEFLSTEQQHEELSFTSNFGDKNGYLIIEKSPGPYPISFKINCDQKINVSAVTKICNIETIVALRDSLVSVLSIRNQE